MEALVSGYALVGKPALFAVSIKDKLGNTHDRVVPLAFKSKYQAELAAIRYVCLAVADKDTDLIIKTSVSQLPQVFTKTEDGEWHKRKKPNELVDETRKLCDQFKSFRLVKDSDSDEMLSLKAKAKKLYSI